MFTVNKPGQGGGKKEDSLLDQVMKTVADGANLSIGNEPSKEKGAPEKDEKLDFLASAKEGAKKHGDTVVEAMGGKAAGQEEGAQKGMPKGLFAPDPAAQNRAASNEIGAVPVLPISSVMLGGNSEKAPSVSVRGMQPEPVKASTGFDLNIGEALQQTSIKAEAKMPAPVPKLELPRFESKGREVASAWAEVASMGITADRSSKGRGQEQGLGLDQNAGHAPARLMGTPGGGGNFS